MTQVRVPRQFARFLLVGGINTGFSYGIYALGLWLGLPYVLANLCALIVGTVFSFVTQGRIVFGHAGRGRFPAFFLSWLAIWLVNVLLIQALLRWVTASEYIAGAIAMAVVVLVSFVVQKRFVFPAS